MIDYREIIRLKNLNHSNAHVAVSVGSSRNTVAEVYRRAEKHKIRWPIPAKQRSANYTLFVAY